MHDKKKLNIAIMLVAWSIWKEHNRRVLEDKVVPLDTLVNLIKGSVFEWFKAQAKCFQSLF